MAVFYDTCPECGNEMWISGGDPPRCRVCFYAPGLVSDTIKYGFELALQYAEIAEEGGKDIIEALKDKLERWDKS